MLLNNMHGAIWIKDSYQPINITGNVVFEAYDKSAILVDQSTGNRIQVGNFPSETWWFSRPIPALLAPHPELFVCVCITSCVQGNLVVNAIKEMAGKSSFDIQMVSCFEIRTQVDVLAQTAAQLYADTPVL